MKRKNVFLGMVGLILGTVPGIILYVIVSRLRIFASFTVVAIFYGSILGYGFFSNLFGQNTEDEFIQEIKYYEKEEKDFSKMTIFFATLFSSAGVYIAEVLDYTFSITKEYPEVPFGEAFNFSLTGIFNNPGYLFISCAIIIFIGISSMIKTKKSYENEKL